MQLSSIQLDDILASLRDAMPLLKRIAKFTPWQSDDDVLDWLELFLSDPKGAEDELLGPNGDNVRAGIKGVLAYVPDVAAFKLLREFLAYVAAEPAKAMKAAMGAAQG